MTTLTLTFAQDDETGDVACTATIQREGETLTRDQVLDACEDLLRAAGFHCQYGSLQFVEPQ